MFTEPKKQHEWLLQLLGDWTYESECPAGPGQPSHKAEGSETVRSIGPLWVICEGKGEMPGGGAAQMVMTLGFDVRRERFVGTWIGSMMDHLWVYDGELDADAKSLTLHSEGPDFTDPGRTAKYKDVITFESADRRTLTGHVLGKDGKWTEMMQARYRRTK